LSDFEIADPARSDNGASTGTAVEVRDITRNFTSLDDAQAVAAELAMQFALYLREYPQARITFNDVAVSTTGLEEHFAELTLPDVTFDDGTTYPVKLAIIDWKMPVERALYYCDADGFAVEKKQDMATLRVTVEELPSGRHLADPAVSDGLRVSVNEAEPITRLS
jgi:hypothetical protein